MTVPFVGSNDLSDLLGEDVTASDLATISLDAACETIRGYIDNQVNLTEETVILDGNHQRRLVLPRPPVRSVTTVVEFEDELVPVDDYVLESSGMLLRVDEVWPYGYGNLEVTYEHGWDIAEPDDPEYTPEDFERVPSDMRAVALALAGRMFSNATASGGGSGAITEESIGGGDYRYKVDAGSVATASKSQLLDDEKLVLERYRLT